MIIDEKEEKEEKIFTYTEALRFNGELLKIVKHHTKALEKIDELINAHRSSLPQSFLDRYKRIPWEGPLV